MTILAELLRNQTYKLPEKFFDKENGYSIEYASDPHRQGGYIRIYNKDRQLIEQISLPEHYLEDMLCEYVVGCFQTLYGGPYSLLSINNELTSIDRSLYTVKDEPINEQNNNIDGQVLAGYAPAMQPGRLVEQVLARPFVLEEWRRITPTREELFRFTGTRWVATGERRDILRDRPRGPRGNTVLNVGQTIQQRTTPQEVAGLDWGGIQRDQGVEDRGE